MEAQCKHGAVICQVCEPNTDRMKAILAQKCEEIASLQHSYALLDERRAQLQADLDRVMAEAVNFAESAYVYAPLHGEKSEACEEFLNRPEVQAYRARKGKETV